MTDDQRTDFQRANALDWWEHDFSCRFRSENLPRPGSALYGRRFVLMEETEDGGLREVSRDD